MNTINRLVLADMVRGSGFIMIPVNSRWTDDAEPTCVGIEAGQTSFVSTTDTDIPLIPTKMNRIKEACGFIPVQKGWTLKPGQTDDTDTSDLEEAMGLLSIDEVTDKDVTPNVKLMPPKEKYTSNEDRSTGQLMLCGVYHKDPTGMAPVLRVFKSVIEQVRAWHVPVVAVPFDVWYFRHLGISMDIDATSSSVQGTLLPCFDAKLHKDAIKRVKLLETDLNNAYAEDVEADKQASIKSAVHRHMKRIRRDFSVSVRWNVLPNWVDYLQRLEGGHRYPTFTKALRAHLVACNAIADDTTAETATA